MDKSQYPDNGARDSDKGGVDRKHLETPNAENIATFISTEGEYLVTVAELTSRLAGLPPMMEVYISADGVSMFLNDTQIEKLADNSPPFFRLVCSKQLVLKQPPEGTIEEQTARKAQQAMQMAHNIDKESKMPEVVD